MAEITAALRDEPARPTAHIDHDTNTGISNTKLGMWLFLASECLLFGGLITTYLLYKRRWPAGPGAQAGLRPRRSRRSARSCCS